MNLDAVLDVVAAALLLSGASLALAAAVGVLRFPDVLTRMHAATKPQVLGILMCISGAAVRLRESPDVWLLVLAAVFQLFTAPVSAHMVARVANRSRRYRRSDLYVDEMPPHRPSGAPTDQGVDQDGAAEPG